MYFEELPKDCPDMDAMPVENTVFFRLVAANPAIDKDFYSHKKLGVWPGKFSNAPECLACSISVLDNINACREIQKLATQKFKMIASVVLQNSDGVVKQTGRNLNHFSWWRSKTFIMSNNISYP